MKLKLEVEITPKGFFVRRFAENGDYLGSSGVATPNKEERETSLYLGGGEFLKLSVLRR